ncbi:MAG: helix-turn-helix transcriptional regulator [Pseudomonadota bacterium]
MQSPSLRKTPARMPGTPGPVNEVDRRLAARIIRARYSAQLSEQDVAEMIGDSVETYRAMELGELRIGALHLSRLAMAHGLPIAWFFEDLPGQHLFDTLPHPKPKDKI